MKLNLINVWNAIKFQNLERYASYIHPDLTQFRETDSSLSTGKDKEIEGIRRWAAKQSSENIKNWYSKILRKTSFIKRRVESQDICIDELVAKLRKVQPILILGELS